MKIILFCFILFLNLHQASSQEDYFVYHNFINQAEDKIAELDFESALIYYDSAFSQFNYVFTKDYVIAAQLAAYQNDRSRCMDYMVRAMYGGYKAYCFQQLYVIKKILNDLDWQEIKRKEILCRETYKTSVNWKLNIDLSRRHRKMDDGRHTKWQDQLLCENYAYLFTLKDNFPFPSARQVGIDDQSIDPLIITYKQGWVRLEDCEACNTKVISTLTSVEDPIRDYGWEYFMRAVRSGDLHPRELSFIYYKNSKNVDCNPEAENLEEDTDLQFYCSPVDPSYDIDRLNADRKSIGLGRFETEGPLYEIGWKYGMKFQFEMGR